MEISIGTGILSWPRAERQTDRYGQVMLANDWAAYIEDRHNPIPLNNEAAGRFGRLVARVHEARESPHIGDLARGIRPSMPEVGEQIDLGVGTLWFGTCDEYTTVGVSPDDGRDYDWMDPEKLYRAIHQTVELVFIPSA